MAVCGQVSRPEEASAAKPRAVAKVKRAGLSAEYGVEVGKMKQEATCRADRPPVRSPIKRRRDTERAIQEHVIPANKLNVELAQGRFDTWTRFLPMDGAAFHVVIIEELERVVTRFDRCFRSMLEFVNTFRLLETRGIVLRQQGKHTGGKPPWGYKVVGPRSNPAKGVKGNRRLEPDWEERAYAAFWTVLVEKEGTSWIADPTIRNLAEVRLAKR